MSASSPSANTEQPQTIKTWSSNTSIENARTKPNFSTYILSKSSSKTIVALHPIPLTFLLKLTHEEQVELANKTDVDVRSAKPGTAQAAVSFMLEDSIKQLCRLGVNKKATRCATSSKPSENTSIGTQTFSENRTAAVSSLTTIKKPNFVFSKNMSNG
jgi:hypothetical protein